jgi:mannose-6-phosphate isomerase-like protein (cupin superfamily)
MTEMLLIEDSGGVLGLTEVDLGAGAAAPVGDHEAADHGYYVLEGELTVRLGEEEPVRLAAGGFAFAPRGVPHSVTNPGEAPARCLRAVTPMAAGDGGPLAPKIVQELPGRVKVLLLGADSGGRISLMDNVVPAKTTGPPLHHHDFDEAFYIIEGEATFRVGDELVTRGPGELVWAPRGAYHCFSNRGDADVRWLLVCTPAGFERYFQQMAAREAGVEPPPEALEPWPEVTVVGPPIAV